MPHPLFSHPMVFKQLPTPPSLPPSLPPSGAAGGDLAGSSYPNPVVAPGAISRAKLAGGLTKNAAAAAIPVAFQITGSPNPYGTWIKVFDFPAITTKGNGIFLSAGPGLMYNSLNGAVCPVGLLFNRNVTNVPGSMAWVNCGIVGTLPIPTHQAQDQPAAGTYTYSFWVWLGANTGGSITVHANGAAWCWATEIP